MAKLSSNSSLQQRKLKLKERIAAYGIDDTGLTVINIRKEGTLPVSAQDAAERLLILLAVSFTAYSFHETDKVMDWLKKEDIWKKVSESEKYFFRSPAPSDEQKAEMSWRFEAAYTLAWALEEVAALPEASSECGEEQVSDFFAHVPSVGMPPGNFLTDARFRPEHELLDEYILFEKVNDYLKDIELGRKENTSGIHDKASRERLNALRWLTGYEGKTDWDEIIHEPDLID